MNDKQKQAYNNHFTKDPSKSILILTCVTGVDSATVTGNTNSWVNQLAGVVLAAILYMNKD